MIPIVSNFFITQWLWSLTTGSAYIVINSLLLFALLKLWDHLGWLRAFVLSLLLTVGAFLIFFVFTGIIFVWWLQVAYILPEDAYTVSYNTLNSSLMLGAFYSVIQMFFLLFINHWKKLNLWRAALCVLCANAMTALLIYKITFAQ